MALQRDGTDGPIELFLSVSTSAETSARGSTFNSNTTRPSSQPRSGRRTLRLSLETPRTAGSSQGVINFRLRRMIILMYSQCMGWPKAVPEASSEGDLARVRVRCEQVMKVLICFTCVCAFIYRANSSLIASGWRALNMSYLTASIKEW